MERMDERMKERKKEKKRGKIRKQEMELMKDNGKKW